MSSGWATLVCPDQKQDRTRLCLINQVCSRQSIRSDLGWGQVQSSRSAERSQCSLFARRCSSTTVDNGWPIRGILLSGDSGPEGQAEKQQVGWARGEVGGGGLKLRERGAGAGPEVQGCRVLGAGSREQARCRQRSCSPKNNNAVNTFLALHIHIPTYLPTTYLTVHAMPSTRGRQTAWEVMGIAEIGRWGRRCAGFRRQGGPSFYPDQACVCDVVCCTTVQYIASTYSTIPMLHAAV